MSRDDFLVHCGLEVQTLELWLEQRWLIPEVSSAGATFAAIDVARAHLIRDLQADFGVNDEGIDVILHLTDQLHGLRRAMEGMREALREAGGE